VHEDETRKGGGGDCYKHDGWAMELYIVWSYTRT